MRLVHDLSKKGMGSTQSKCWSGLMLLDSLEFVLDLYIAPPFVPLKVC